MNFKKIPRQKQARHNHFLLTVKTALLVRVGIFNSIGKQFYTFLYCNKNTIQKFFEKYLYFLIIIAVSLAVLFLQKQLQGSIPYLRLGIERTLVLMRSPWAWGLGLGIIFGLISCPVCGVPLTLYIAGREDSLKAALWSVTSFSLGRFVVFLSSAILAVLAGMAVIQLNFLKLLPGLFTTVGILMIVLGLSLFQKAASYKSSLLLSTAICKLPAVENITACLKKACCYQNSFLSKHYLRLNKPGQKFLKLKYMLWGSLLGIPCSLEGLGFVIPIWFNALVQANRGYAILCMCLFCAGAFIPSLIMVMSGWCGVHYVPDRIKNKILSPARFVGALVLFITGCRYIWMGIAQAKNLLALL